MSKKGSPGSRGRSKPQNSPTNLLRSFPIPVISATILLFGDKLIFVKSLLFFIHMPSEPFLHIGGFSRYVGY